MDRPIKAHLDEPMRNHLEYVLRRYLEDCRRINPKNVFSKESNDYQIRLTEICLKEVMEAGT